MKILIVTKGYYPHGDANGAVVRNVAEALAKTGHRVHVVGLSGEKADTAVTERHGERMTNLYVPEMRSRAQLMGELRGHFARTGWLILRRALAEGKRSLLRKYRDLSIYPPYAKAYRRFFREHLRKETYDLVLITLMPQDAVWAWQWEGSPLPWAVYQLDTFWNRGTDREEHLEERKAFERKMAEECAFVLTTPLIAAENGRQWPELKDKWISSEFPMVVCPEGIRTEKDFVRDPRGRERSNFEEASPFREVAPATAKGTDDFPTGMNGRPVHLVFAGALYPGLRPPEKVVQVIAAWREIAEGPGQDGRRELAFTEETKYTAHRAAVSQNHAAKTRRSGEKTAREEATGDASICFDFYGSHQELIEASPDYDRARDWLKLHGQVSSGEAAAAREAADFLINIDNTNPMQVPSKIFEYISTGKPIVNFVFDDESPILPYLRDYPLCLTVNLNRMADGGRKAAERLSAFVKENRGRRIPFGEIRERYLTCTPEYVARQLVEAFTITRP